MPTVLLAIALALLLVWPWPLHPTRLVGHPAGETPNHYEMLWRAIQPGEVTNLPEGIPIPVMDPVNLPFFALGDLVHPAVGYAFVVIGNLLLAFAGAWALAGALGAGPGGRRIAGVAAMSAPFLGGVISFGITEALPVGWLALHLALLLRWHREGKGELLAGVCLGLFALSGWYNAFFGLVVEAFFLLWLRRLPWRAGLVALVMVLPALWLFLPAREAWEGRFHPPSPFPVPYRQMWRTMPTYGADLLNFVLPGLDRVPVSKSVYLGIPVLLLALAGPRVLWLLVLPLLLLALGHWLSIAGHTDTFGVSVPMPAGLLIRWIPALEGLSHWHRALGPATPLLAAAAGVGASRWVEERRWLEVLLGVAIVGDSLAFSQNVWPRDLADPTLPAAYSAMRGEGAMVELPLDNGWSDAGRGPDAEVGDAIPRTYDLYQPGADRGRAENYDGPDSILKRSALVAQADAACGVKATTPRSWAAPKALLAPDRITGVALEAELRALREMGFSFVILHKERARTPGRAEALLRAALGEPIADTEGVLVWSIPG